MHGHLSSGPHHRQFQPGSTIRGFARPIPSEPLPQQNVCKASKCWQGFSRIRTRDAFAPPPAHMGRTFSHLSRIYVITGSIDHDCSSRPQNRVSTSASVLASTVCPASTCHILKRLVVGHQWIQNFARVDTNLIILRPTFVAGLCVWTAVVHSLRLLNGGVQSGWSVEHLGSDRSELRVCVWMDWCHHRTHGKLGLYHLHCQWVIFPSTNCCSCTRVRLFRVEPSVFLQPDFDGQVLPSSRGSWTSRDCVGRR